MHHRSNHLGRSLFVLLLLAAGACGTTQEGQGAPDSRSTPAAKKPDPLPWTQEFQKSSTLVAREVLIEGPPGLIAHVAFRQLPGQNYVAKTTPEGFLQEVTVDNDQGELIRIQIDNLAVAAERRIRVLERLVDGPVRVRATGDVFWKNLETGEEHRSESLDLTGARPR